MSRDRKNFTLDRGLCEWLKIFSEEERVSMSRIIEDALFDLSSSISQRKAEEVDVG